MKKIIFLTLIMNLCFSDIFFSGDARFRPRYDIKEFGKNSILENGDNVESLSNIYYQYRARLNIKADIGDGWFFNSKIGTNNDVAGMTKMEYGTKPELSFMEIYFGYQDKDCGYWAGLLPLKSNPALDIHFYSDDLVDIPFVLKSNSTIAGLSGFSTISNHKLNWFLSMELNNDNSIVIKPDMTIDSTITVEISDLYTLGFDMNFDLGPISATPRVLISKGDVEADFGLDKFTYGTEFKLPSFSNVKSTLSYYISSSDGDDDAQIYESNHMRFLVTSPLKNGKLKFFYDMASKDDDDISYLWLSYTHSCYKGDMGEVTISPTYRLQTGKLGDEDYSRNKIEITTQIKFN